MLLQGPKQLSHLSRLSQLHYQGTGWEVKQPGAKGHVVLHCNVANCTTKADPRILLNHNSKLTTVLNFISIYIWTIPIAQYPHLIIFIEFSATAYKYTSLSHLLKINFLTIFL